MTDPQIIRAPNGDELVVLTRAAYDELVAAAAAADLSEEDEDAADLEVALAAKDDWEAAGRPVIPLAVVRRVRTGDSYLRAFRLEAGLTQAELAARARITQGYLSECETSRKVPNESTREALAKVLHIHPLWLSEEAPQSSATRNA